MKERKEGGRGREGGKEINDWVSEMAYQVKELAVRQFWNSHRWKKIQEETYSHKLSLALLIDIAACRCLCIHTFTKINKCKKCLENKREE